MRDRRCPSGPGGTSAGRDFPIAEDDIALVRLDQSDHHVESRRFPGAVGSQQADNFTGRDVQGDTVDDPPASVGLAETLCHEIERFRAQGSPPGSKWSLYLR